MAYWLMICPHRSGMDAHRDAVRDAHRLHVSSGGGGSVKVLIGSGLTADDSEQAAGHFGVIDAPSRADVEAFAKGDPFYLAGIVERIEITRLASRFPAHRIAPP